MPKLKSNDQSWLDVNKGKAKEKPSKPLADTPEGPYYVGWTAQSHEWYGDEDPASGKGRYKAKGNGGTILARDIKSYAHAKKMADELDKKYKEGKFYDKSVYGKMGKDWYLNSYHGAYVGSHPKAKEEDNEDQWDLDYSAKIAKLTGKRNRPTSFAKYVKESAARILKEKLEEYDPAKYDAKDFSQPMKDPIRVGLNGVIERQAAKLKHGVFDTKATKSAVRKAAFKERMTTDPHFKEVK